MMIERDGDKRQRIEIKKEERQGEMENGEQNKEKATRVLVGSLDIVIRTTFRR